MLRGKIAKILSQTKIVINIGNKQGVKIGMKFVIYDEGEMIFDPEDNQPIEKIELVKGNFEITQVQEKTSIGESYKIETKYFPGLYESLEAMASFGGKYVENTKVSVPLTKAIILEEVKEPTQLKVGDLVRSIE